MSANSTNQNTRSQTNTQAPSTTSNPQQSASQNATNNARQQVDQILEQRKEGFSFENIADSILESIGNLWKSLGITNLIEYIAGFFGFSAGSENSSTQAVQEETVVPDRSYPLQNCDIVPEGGKLMFANNTIDLFKDNQCAASYSGNKLYKGERAIIMPNQPESGSYKIKALGRGTETQATKYLYIKQSDFSKLQATHPGARVQRGQNAYLTGDSISQGLIPRTAYGDGMPSMSGLYVVNSIAGRLSNNPNDIPQKRLAFVMGFNDLKGRDRQGNTFYKSEAAIKKRYDDIFAVLVNIKRNYGKTIALNGLYQWTEEGSTTVEPNSRLFNNLNKYIKQKCAYFGFKYVDMTPYTDPKLVLHQPIKNAGQFIDAMTS